MSNSPGGFELIIIFLFWLVPIAVTLFVSYWVVRIAVRHELRINPPRLQSPPDRPSAPPVPPADYRY